MLFEKPETHLHPQWQQHIVPALLRVLSGLAPEMRPQVLLTTHAPLVLASLEPHFDRDRDKLFSFELKDRREVVLEELPWTRYGDAVGWLTSPVFDLPDHRRPHPPPPAPPPLRRGHPSDTRRHRRSRAARDPEEGREIAVKYRCRDGPIYVSGCERHPARPAAGQPRRRP